MGGGSSKGDNEDKVDKLAATAPDEELVAAARDLPLPPGHQLLAEFASALEREYALREGPIVGDFLDGLDEARLKRESIKVKNFITWTEWVEALIRRSYSQRMVMNIEELREIWGLSPPAQGSS